MIQNSYLHIIYDSDYISHDKANEHIERIFEGVSKIDKGVKYLKDFKIEINNKYYQCSVDLKINSHDNISDSDQSEGILLYLTANSIRDNKFTFIANKLNNKEFSTSIIIFEEDRTTLSSLSDYEKFLSLSIENNFEVITGIGDTNEISEDDGIGALNLALQTSKWSNSVYHNQDKKQSTIETSVKQEIPYSLLNDDFEKCLETVQAAMRSNMGGTISDEERRANAERTIMMLAKAFNFEESEDEEAQVDSDN